MKSLATTAIWYTSDSYTAASKFSLMKGHKGGCQPATPFKTGLSGKLKRADLKDSRKFWLRATEVSLFPLILSCNHPFWKFHIFQQTKHATPNIASSNNSFKLRSLVENFGVETPGFNVKGAGRKEGTIEKYMRFGFDFGGTKISIRIRPHVSARESHPSRENLVTPSP